MTKEDVELSLALDALMKLQQRYDRLANAAKNVVSARHYNGDDGWDRLKNAICELEGETEKQ